MAIIDFDERTLIALSSLMRRVAPSELFGAVRLPGEIHPVNNLRVLASGARDEGRWLMRPKRVVRALREGPEAFERQLMQRPASTCHGDTPTLAGLPPGAANFNAQR
jgi:hypothetical protein